MEDATEAGHTSKLEEIVRTRALRFSATVQGLVTGLLAGLVVFVATNWLILKGGTVVGPHLALLGQFLVGYRVTFVGSFVGFAYAFILGYIVGYSVATLYNLIAGWRDGLRLQGAPTGSRRRQP